MAASVLAALEQLYGSNKYADCIVNIYTPTSLASDEPAVALPGHLHVLLAGSELFQAQAERWPQQCDNDISCKLCGATNSSFGQVLRVSLDHAGDLPYALAALRFLYSGNLDQVVAEVGGQASASGGYSGERVDSGAAAGPDTPGASRSGSPTRGVAVTAVNDTPSSTSSTGTGSGPGVAAALLHTRRLALYLHMPDCVAACEAELVEVVRRAAGAAVTAAANTTPGGASTASPGPRPTFMDARLAAVADVYAARELLAPPLLLLSPPGTPMPPHLPSAGREASDVDPRAAALGCCVRLACLEQLVGWAKENISTVQAENQELHRKWQQQQQQQQQQQLQQQQQQQQQLQQQPQQQGQGSGAEEAPPAAGQRPELQPPQPPTFGELLAWAVCSAPHALTNQESRKLVLQLPAVALEALLLAENFATDDESTVLLLLAEWQSASATPRVDALAAALRLAHMNAAYSIIVLPLLVDGKWITVSRVHLGLIAQCGGGSLAARQRICRVTSRHSGAQDGVRWFHPAPRPQPPPRVLDWSVDGAALAAAAAGADVFAKQFASEKLVASGFEWTVAVQHASAAARGTAAATAATAGVFMWCYVPQSVSARLRYASYDQPRIMAHPAAIELTVFRKAAGQGGSSSSGSNGSSGSCGSSSKWTPAFVMTCGDGDFAVCNQEAWGEARALPLADPESQQEQLGQGQEQRGQGQGQGAERLAAWEPYLIEGQLRGQLRWGA